MWEKIVLNLLSNAFKFTFEGEVAVRLDHRGDRVELSVRDTGTGISEVELPHVFERFRRVEGARGRSFEGSGIGLSLVHELVRLHGGSVRVTSALGRGTTFVVAIPTGSAHLPPDRVVASTALAAPRSFALAAQILEAKQWIRPEREPAKPAEPAAVPSVREARARVLVADDNADMRNYVERLLAPHWDVELCPDGKAALASALASPPDLVLSDVMMPEMDGVALLGALRADTRTRTVPVILISARAGEEARLAGLETGADDYLVKPFSAREIVTRVRTHLEMARVRRQAYEELARAQAQLVHAAKLASLGELVAGIAHEINNPLAFALGHLGTVERSLHTVQGALGSALVEAAAGPWDRALSRVRETHGGLERIQELVLKLRTFARLDEGERKHVSVSESVGSVLTILGHRLADRIVVETRFGEPDGIDCFAALLNQAIMNLLTNAIDAIDAAGGAGTVTITTGARDGVFELLVADTGCGVSETARARVFDPFFTTKPVGHGTGLGLSITDSIAKRHGGEVSLSPRPGGGTVAALRFPLGATYSKDR
jgi:signal transduction histidine kinase